MTTTTTPPPPTRRSTSRLVDDGDPPITREAKIRRRDPHFNRRNKGPAASLSLSLSLSLLLLLPTAHAFRSDLRAPPPSSSSSIGTAFGRPPRRDRPPQSPGGPTLTPSLSDAILRASSSPAASAAVLRGRTRDDDQWFGRLDELRAYRDDWGSVDVKRTGPSPTLGNWAARQRRDYAAMERGERSPMSGSRIDALEALGFEWKTRSGEERWGDRLEELKGFGAVHGHVDVPESEEFGGLATWVKNQRTEHSKRRDGLPSSLTDERRARLEALGFCWDVHEALWRRRFAELERFKEDYGHCNVPMSCGSLGDWVLKVRTNYNRIRRNQPPVHPSLLTDERVDDLIRIGFDFHPLETQFRERLDELLEFRRKYGHINVGNTEGRLSTWYYRQRAEYKKHVRGERTSLTPERLSGLEGAGFYPSMFNETLRPGSSRPCVPWEERFEDLAAYKEENGDCNVSWSQGALGRWVKEQRSSCSNATRVDKLNELGFVWDIRDYQWWNKYRELVDFYMEFGHSNVPHSRGELGEWVAQQRKCNDREGDDRLMDMRRSALDKIEFVWDRGGQIRTQNEERWDDKFRKLEEHKDRSGDCRVPRSAGKLYEWVRRQRTLYRAFSQGKTSSLTERRRHKLDSIGFE